MESEIIAMHDYEACKTSVGDTQIRICLHRGGYGGLARQSTATYVLKEDMNIAYEEYAKYGNDDELK